MTPLTRGLQGRAGGALLLIGYGVYMWYKSL